MIYALFFETPAIEKLSLADITFQGHSNLSEIT